MNGEKGILRIPQDTGNALLVTKMPNRTNPDKNIGSTQNLYLTPMSPGTVFDIETENHSYKVEYLGHGAAWISGDPEVCPKPRLVNILGSCSGGLTLKMSCVEQGMGLEFQEPGLAEVFITSPIRRIYVRPVGRPGTAPTSTAAR